MKKLEGLQLESKARRENLKIALETVYPIREQLQKDLIETQSDELLDKIIALNKIIEDAEVIVEMSGKDALKYYTEKHPEYVNEDETINDRGVRRVAILKKKWKKLGFLKNKA
tara:strand:+ start:3135 stop:3473 length:339 start_codon:yes stop_codon:yes gene_type:complete